MEEVIYIEGIKEAAPVGWNGSYADGGKSQSWWLPVTVVSSHICDNITLNVPSRAFSNVPFVTDSNVPLQKWLL